MPISYHLPSHIESDAQTSGEIPPQYKRLKISLPGTKVIVKTGDWGIIIHQSVKLGGNLYSELYVLTKADLTISVLYDSNIISMHAVYEGSIVLKIMDQAIVFRPKYQSMHYIPKGDVHQAEISAGVPYHSVILSPERSLLSRIAITFNRLDAILEAFTHNFHHHLMLPFTRFRKTSRSELTKLRNVKYPGIGMDEYLHNRVSDYVLGYVNQIHNEYPDEVMSQVISDKIDGLMNMIVLDPAPSLSLSETASKLGLPQSVLKSAFQVKAGTTLMSYVIQARISKAKALLDRKELTVADIAMTVGYSDHSYFTRLFKKITGYTPSELRGAQD